MSRLGGRTSLTRAGDAPRRDTARTIFAQPDHASALAQLEKVVDGLRPRFAQAATLLADAAEDLLAHKHFPAEHRTRLHSTNPLERLNKEIKRRSNVVGIFRNSPALLRLVGAILMDQDDEWTVADRRYFSAESMRQLTQPLPTTTAQELLTAIVGGRSVVAVENRGAVFPRSSKSSVSVRAINDEELGDGAIFHHLTGRYPRANLDERARSRRQGRQPRGARTLDAGEHTRTLLARRCRR